jgi:hypothetical protein
MGIEIPEEQFLHHQLGLMYGLRNPGTPIGGQYKPTMKPWTNNEWTVLMTALRGGQSWTPTLVEELESAGCIPIIKNAYNNGTIDRNHIIDTIRAKHNEDPQVMWEVNIEFSDEESETFVARFNRTDTAGRDAWIQEQIKDQYPDYVFNSAEHEFDSFDITLRNRYDYWMAYFQPIPVFTFDSTGKPIDLHIDLESCKIPLGINEQYVWTRVWMDNCEVIIPGYHYMNRLSYIVTTHPWDADIHQDLEVID